MYIVLVPELTGAVLLAKDLFEAFYMRLFAKRLLLNKSASSDMEKLMLVKLREGTLAFYSVEPYL